MYILNLCEDVYVCMCVCALVIVDFFVSLTCVH